MATGSEGSWAITLPNQFAPIGELMQQTNALNERRNQMLYSVFQQNQQKKQQDEWKKLGLIQELTDLSKHQTSSDVANALANQQMQKIYQKYTGLSSTLSPTELQYQINKDMSGVINSLDGIKQELDLGDEQLKTMKAANPNLDYAKLQRDLRADIINRRVKSDEEFTPLMEIKPSALDLSNPDFLSNYSVGNKNIISSIVDPKGAENETVLMGKQGDYTKFEGKLPFWKTPNYDRNKFDKEGFYSGKEMPSFKIKSTVLDPKYTAISGGKPLDIIDKDVYERFAQDGAANLELTAATKKQYPDYDNLNPTDKEYAKRNVLYNQIKAYDQSELHPTSNVRPPVTRVSINNGASRTQADEINDLYGRIYNRALESKQSGLPFLSLNTMPFDEQKAIVEFANSVSPKEWSGQQTLGQNNLKVIIGDDGRIGVYKSDETNPQKALIGYIPKIGTNIKVQPGVKQKTAVIRQGEGKQPATRPSAQNSGAQTQNKETLHW